MGALIDEAFAKAALLANKIQRTPNFELLMQPETNIVCFRYLANRFYDEALNQHQKAIRQHVIQGGSFHITQVDLHGETWLRTTLMNAVEAATQRSHELGRRFLAATEEED